MNKSTGQIILDLIEAKDTFLRAYKGMTAERDEAREWAMQMKAERDAEKQWSNILWNSWNNTAKRNRELEAQFNAVMQEVEARNQAEYANRKASITAYLSPGCEPPFSPVMEED